MDRNKGYETLDPGHRYRLGTLDGELDDDLRTLQFVKRTDSDPTKFPRNEDAYPGATCQFVIRVISDRVRYLNGQKPCVENQIILFLLQSVLWLFEKRAARRHGRTYDHSPEFAEVAPTCPECGHTVCEHGGENGAK